jgi:hypothetical protein
LPKADSPADDAETGEELAEAGAAGSSECSNGNTGEGEGAEDVVVLR